MHHAVCPCRRLAGLAFRTQLCAECKGEPSLSAPPLPLPPCAGLLHPQPQQPLKLQSGHSRAFHPMPRCAPRPRYGGNAGAATGSRVPAAVQLTAAALGSPSSPCGAAPAAGACAAAAAPPPLTALVLLLALLLLLLPLLLSLSLLLLLLSAAGRWGCRPQGCCCGRRACCCRCPSSPAKALLLLASPRCCCFCCCCHPRAGDRVVLPVGLGAHGAAVPAGKQQQS